MDLHDAVIENGLTDIQTSVGGGVNKIIETRLLYGSGNNTGI